MHELMLQIQLRLVPVLLLHKLIPFLWAGQLEQMVSVILV